MIIPAGSFASTSIGVLENQTEALEGNIHVLQYSPNTQSKSIS